jgi:hypothetical protein
MAGGTPCADVTKELAPKFKNLASRAGFVSRHTSKPSTWRNIAITLRNSAVRYYRGASENVAMVEMRSQLAIERAGLVTLHLQPARRSSIPTINAVVSIALFKLPKNPLHIATANG